MISMTDRIRGALACLRGDALVFGVRWRYRGNGVSHFRARDGGEILAFGSLVEIYDADQQSPGIVRFPQPWRARAADDSELRERRAARHRHPSRPPDRPA